MPRAGAGGGAPYVAPPAPRCDTPVQHATSREPRKLSPALDAPLLGRGPSPSTASQLLSPTARAATWSAAASRGRWRSRAAPTIARTTSRLTLRARGPGRCQRRRSAPGRCQAGRAGRQGSGSRRRQAPLRRARTCPETQPPTTCTTHGQPTGGDPPAATETRAGCTERTTEARMCHSHGHSDFDAQLNRLGSSARPCRQFWLNPHPQPASAPKTLDTVYALIPVLESADEHSSTLLRPCFVATVFTGPGLYCVRVPTKINPAGC